MNRKEEQSTRGIVHAEAGRDKFRLQRFEPGSELKPFIEHYWTVTYNLPPGLSHTQQVLSYPNLHLAFEQDEQGQRALLYGVPLRPFERKLQGSGRVLGIKFRAGGFQPFWGQNVSELTGKVVRIGEIWGSEVDNWTDKILGSSDELAMAAQAEAYLCTLLPARDALAEQADEVVRTIHEQRDIVLVESLSKHTGISIRQLQRMFRKYVGVTPKWVIKRFRLQEAAELLEQNAQVSYAELAAQLGYFDQAHFIKDFKSLLGQSPSAYRQGGVNR